MHIEAMKFKTNIKCSGCIAKVSPHLDQLVGTDNWKVDLESPEKVLTISSEEVSENTLKVTVNKAGYELERI